MNAHFDLARITRKNILTMTEEYSIEEMNQVPDGFNNNLIWNLGHVLVTQQLLCYKLSGNAVRIDSELIDKYKKGTRPSLFIDDLELEYIIEMMSKTIDSTEKDYQNGLFKNYQEYQTSYNVTLKKIEDAIAFNNIHESMHYGYMLALRKGLE